MQEAEDSLNLRLLGLPREYQASQRASLFYTLVGDSSGLWVGVPERQKWSDHSNALLSELLTFAYCLFIAFVLRKSNSSNGLCYFTFLVNLIIC